MSNEQNDQEAIEGTYDSREESAQRAAIDNSGVGEISHPNGATSDDDEGYYGDESSGSSYGTSGGTETGSSITPHGSQSHKHAHGRGRNTEGAFGEEESRENANPLNDIADAGISKREIGSSGTGERTQGGHS